MGSRAIKKEVLSLLKAEGGLEPVFRELKQYRAIDAVNVLFSAICHGDSHLRWVAVSCMGEGVTRMAKEDMESARVMMRRLLWSLNDESGGIGWGAPESMAEIMCRHDGLAEEYVHMLLSYMLEDGEEICQDGNYLEHVLLQRGLIWGVSRLAACRPDLLKDRGIATALPPYLSAGDTEVRGLAVLAAARLKLAATRPMLEKLIQQADEFVVYEDGSFVMMEIGKLARQGLEELAGE